MRNGGDSGYLLFCQIFCYPMVLSLSFIVGLIWLALAVATAIVIIIVIVIVILIVVVVVVVVVIVVVIIIIIVSIGIVVNGRVPGFT